MEDIILLEQLGLTKTEAEVYLALLKLGSTTAGPLIKKTELHRATVYDVLKRLMEKGLVNYITKEKTKYFEATDPSHLIDIIKQEKENLRKKEEITKKAVESLEKIKKLEKQEEVHMYIGKQGLKTIYEDLLKECKEYVSLGSRGSFKEIMGPFFDLFQKRKRKLGIKSRILLPSDLRRADFIKITYGQYRFLPPEYGGPTNTFVYNDKVIIFIFTENPTALVIQNKEVANMYKKYFELLWGIAKK